MPLGHHAFLHGEAPFRHDDHLNGVRHGSPPPFLPRKRCGEDDPPRISLPNQWPYCGPPSRTAASIWPRPGCRDPPEPARRAPAHAAPSPSSPAPSGPRRSPGRTRPRCRSPCCSAGAPRRPRPPGRSPRPSPGSCPCRAARWSSDRRRCRRARLLQIVRGLVREVHHPPKATMVTSSPSRVTLASPKGMA